MRTTSAADLLVEALLDWEAEVTFGLPGDGINGIVEALRKRQDEIRFFRCATKRARHSWPVPTPS